MSTKIILAEISDPALTRRKFYYPGFSTSLKGTAVDIDPGGDYSFYCGDEVTAQTGGAALLPAIPLDSFCYFEVRPEYISNGLLGIGVCRAGTNYNVAPGNSSDCAVYRSDGQFRQNSVNTAATLIGSYTDNDIIGVFVDTKTTAGSARVYFRKNNTFQDADFNSLGTPDITLSSGSGDFHLYVGFAGNAGFNATLTYVTSSEFTSPFLKNAYAFDRYNYALSGSETQFTETLRFSTLPYITKSTDSPANTIYEPRILNDIEYSRDLGLWIWGDSRTSTSIGFLEIADPEGKYDYLMMTNCRDLRLTIYQVGEGDAYSTKTLLATLIIDKVEYVANGSKRFYLRDRSTALDIPILNSTYSTAIPNTSLQGKPRPFGYGILNWVEPQPVDLVNLIYDLGDVNRRNVASYRDQGLIVSTFAETAIPLAEVNGFRRTTAPAGVQTIQGLTVRKVAQTIAAAQGSEFTNWTADNPDGWTVTETAPNNIVTQTVAGQARFVSNGAATVQILNNHGVASSGDERVYWEIEVSARVSGRLQVMVGGFNVQTIQEVGFYKGMYIFSPGTTDFAIRVPAGETADISINYARVWRSVRTDIFHYALENLLFDKGGLTSADVVSADYNTVSIDFQNGTHSNPNAVTDYFDSQTNVSDAVTSLLGTYLCGWYIDSSFKFRVVPWRLPLSGDVSQFTFDRSNIVKDSLSIEFDELAGLATVIRWGKNQRVLSDAEFAGAVSAADRAALREEFQSLTSANSRIADCYKSAIGRFYDTVFNASTWTNSPRALAHLVREMAAVPRNFFRLRACASDPTMYSLKLGDVVTLRYYEQGGTFFLAERKLRVKKISGKFGSDELEFVLWG